MMSVQNKMNLKQLTVAAAVIGGTLFLLLGAMRFPLTASAHPAAQATATAQASATITSTTATTTTNACGIVMSNQVITPTTNVTATVVATEPTATVTPTVAVAPATPVSPTAQVLRIGEDVYPDELDPQRASFVNEFEILTLAYEGLTSVDPSGNVVPAAAEKYEFNADGTVLTFTLRSGLKRVDGTPITSKDFANAIRRGVNPCIAGRQYVAVLYDIQGAQAASEFDVDNGTPADLQTALNNVAVQTPDDQTLALQFTHPVGSYWLDVASLPIFFPTDTKLASDSEEWASVAGNHNGNGPFIILTLDEGNAITLVPNPNYRSGKPTLDRIEFKYNTDNQTQLDAYKNGDLDIDAAVTAELVPQIISTTLQSEFYDYDSAQTYALAFNNSLKPFDDRIVRAAFSQALDRAGFVKNELLDTGKPTTRWIPAGVPGNQADKPGVPDSSPDAAKKELVDNGYGTADGKVDCAKLGTIKFTYPDSPINQARVQYISTNLQNVFGCPITPDPVNSTEFTRLTNSVATNPQMSLQRWVEDYPHPQNWLSAYWTCGSFAKNYGYCNLFVDDLLKQADSTADFEAATKLYQQAEDLLIKDVPGAFLYNVENLALVKPYVVGPQNNQSPRDAGWIGQWGPLSQYSIDLSKVPESYPKE